MPKKPQSKDSQGTLEAPALNEIKVLPIESRMLNCKLTNDELLEKGQALAKVIQDIDSEEHLQTNTKASMKARMTNLEKERGELTLTISRKNEDRMVDVEPLFDYTGGIYMETRRDTGEVILRRPLYDHERQTAMFDAEATSHIGDDAEKLEHETESASA